VTFCFGSFTFGLASEYQVVFGNGCRAPSWRQLHGDISYIEVKFHDDHPIYITANTQGYFVNQVEWINYSCWRLSVCHWKSAALMPRNWFHMNFGHQIHWHKKKVTQVCARAVPCTQTRPRTHARTHACTHTHTSGKMCFAIKLTFTAT